MNKLGRGPLCDATYQISLDALGLLVSDKEIFIDFILKTYFKSNQAFDLDMQQTGTNRTIIEEGHVRIISAKFGHNF